MNRTEMACYCLMASAVVLAALLVTQLQDRNVLNTAQADMVISSGSFTAMTARTRPDEEALFVLENNSQRLAIYTLDAGRNRIDLVHEPIPLNQLFNNQQQTGGGGGSGRRPR